MRSEDLYFRKAEGNIKDNMHGCAYEDYDCKCKLTEEYGICIHKSVSGMCTYVPSKQEIFEMERNYFKLPDACARSNVKILKKITFLKVKLYNYLEEKEDAYECLFRYREFKN